MPINANGISRRVATITIAVVLNTLVGSALGAESPPAPDGGAPPVAAPTASAAPSDPTPPTENNAGASSAPPAPSSEPPATTAPSAVPPSQPAPPPPSVSAAAASPPAPAAENVTVVGHRLDETLPNELGRYGTRIDTIHSEEIRNAGEPDVAGSLEKLAPGMYLSPKNGPFDYFNLSFQGSRTQDVLFLLDGVRLNNRLYGGTTPLDTFPSSVVERLEIVEGPQALFYGTQSVAGAVNIVTRSFTDSSEPDGAVAIGADTTGGRHVDGYVRTALGRHRFVVWGSGDSSQGFQAFRDQDYQPSGTVRKRGYDVLTLGGKYAYDIRPDLRVSALYQHTDATLDYAQPYLVALANNQRAEDVATAKLEYSPTDAAEFFAKGYVHRWKSYYTEFDHVVGGASDALTSVDDHDAWGFWDIGANAVAKVTPARLFDVFAGYDVQTYNGSDAVLVIKQQSEVVNAVFGEIRTPEQLKKIRLAAGLRYNVPSVGESALVWNATGQFTVSDAFFVRGTTGSAFRLPTAEELFANDPQDERGNPNLKPEHSFNANVSVGGNASFAKLPGLSWEAIGFYRDVIDLISLSGFDSATKQSLFENVAGTVRVRGGTLVLDARLPQGWSGTASYTYSSAQQQSGIQVDRIPLHLAKAWLDWHPDYLPIGAMLVLSYVGDVYQSFGDTDREKIDRHFLLDVGARVLLGEERRHKISATLSNALGTVYASSLGKATPDSGASDYTYWNLGAPRTLSVRYQYKF